MRSQSKSDGFNFLYVHLIFYGNNCSPFKNAFQTKHELAYIAAVYKNVA